MNAVYLRMAWSVAQMVMAIVLLPLSLIYAREGAYDHATYNLLLSWMMYWSSERDDAAIARRVAEIKAEVGG